MQSTGTIPWMHREVRLICIEEEISVIPFMSWARYLAWPSKYFLEYSGKILLVSGFASCRCSATSNYAPSSHALARILCSEDELVITYCLSLMSEILWRAAYLG
jgi:hypothetical protein